MQSSCAESTPHNAPSQNAQSCTTDHLSGPDTSQDESINVINYLDQYPSEFDLPVPASDGNQTAPLMDDIEIAPCSPSQPYPRLPSRLPNPLIALDYLVKARAHYPDCSQPPYHPLFNQPIQYQINQEVHLLDSSGTERTGISTYRIISSTSSAPEVTNLTTTHPLLPQLQVLDPSQERIYTLLPITHTKFTTTTPHILPVGYPLGAEVKQYTNPIPALIIRRTVHNGQRIYDLKDQTGDVQYDVNEAEIKPWSGGEFDFREVRE